MRRLLGPATAALAGLLVAIALPGTASALELRLMADGFGLVTQVTAPRSGEPPGTLYVVERTGVIWKVKDDDRALFLDLSAEVSCCTGERGLHSIAFDPNYAANGLLYVGFTNLAGNTRVVRFRANPGRTGVVPESRRHLLGVRQPNPFHNGGRLQIGPNRRLYVGLGDGGGVCDPNGLAQKHWRRHGNLLSLNPRKVPSGWRVDAYGLRNPWGYSFDRADGRLFLGDVGQDRWEEVNTLPASALGGVPENFLWNAYEGGERNTCPNARLRGPGPRVLPIAVYGRKAGCAVIGGHVYRGGALKSQRGWYFFGDHCTGRIWRLLYRDGKVVRKRQLVLDTDLRLTSFGEGVNGELHVTDRDGGVYRLVR